jgi:hypothetical protein
MVNDLWVSKLRKVDVPCVSSCILNDFTGVMNVRKQLNPSRSEVDKTSPLLLLSFDFLTLDTKSMGICCNWLKSPFDPVQKLRWNSCFENFVLLPQ